MTLDPINGDSATASAPTAVDPTEADASHPPQAPPDRALLDRVEGEIAKVEATLAQLSDPTSDIAAVTSWLPTS